MLFELFAGLPLFGLLMVGVVVWLIYTSFRDNAAATRRLYCVYCRTNGHVRRHHTQSRSGRNVIDLQCGNCGMTQRVHDH
nr:hypothetical protein [uncultured Actinoplanes sp.]